MNLWTCDVALQTLRELALRENRQLLKRSMITQLSSGQATVRHALFGTVPSAMAAATLPLGPQRQTKPDHKAPSSTDRTTGHVTAGAPGVAVARRQDDERTRHSRTGVQPDTSHQHHDDTTTTTAATPQRQTDWSGRLGLLTYIMERQEDNSLSVTISARKQKDCVHSRSASNWKEAQSSLTGPS